MVLNCSIVSQIGMLVKDKVCFTLCGNQDVS